MVLEDFKRALARVQSDYSFYIACQTNPAAALEGYVLDADERQALLDPDKLAAMIKNGIGISRIPSITVKISGTHDWVNSSGTKEGTVETKEMHAAAVAIREARTDQERAAATMRLMELLG